MCYTILCIPKQQGSNRGGKGEFIEWGRHMFQTHLAAGFRQWPGPGALRAASQPLWSSKQSLLPLMVVRRPPKKKKKVRNACFRLCLYYYIPMGKEGGVPTSSGLLWILSLLLCLLSSFLATLPSHFTG